MQFTDLAIEILADLLVIPIAFIGLWMMIRLPRAVRYQRIARAVITGLSALLVAKIASLFYQGERPFVELGAQPKATYLNNPGFPSDHVLLVFTITFIVWVSTKNLRMSLLLLGLSLLVALGRVLALVHTPLDVAGGIVCAFLVVLFWYGRALFTRKLPASQSF